MWICERFSGCLWEGDLIFTFFPIVCGDGGWVVLVEFVADLLLGGTWIGELVYTQHGGVAALYRAFAVLDDNGFNIGIAGLDLPKDETGAVENQHNRFAAGRQSNFQAAVAHVAFADCGSDKGVVGIVNKGFCFGFVIRGVKLFGLGNEREANGMPMVDVFYF